MKNSRQESKVYAAVQVIVLLLIIVSSGLAQGSNKVTGMVPVNGTKLHYEMAGRGCFYHIAA